MVIVTSLFIFFCLGPFYLFLTYNLASRFGLFSGKAGSVLFCFFSFIFYSSSP
jgi:hypothetical protein